MRIYAHLLVALAGRDLEEIAAGSGVAEATIRAASQRGIPMDLADQHRLATHLGIPRHVLFRTWGLLDLTLVDLQPTIDDAPSEFITDPDVLRAIDRRSA